MFIKYTLTAALLLCAVVASSQSTMPRLYKTSNARAKSAEAYYAKWWPSINDTANWKGDNVPQFFSNNVINYNDSLSNIALYSELASDYIGPVRVSAGVTLSYPKTDTNTVQQQKLNREKFIQRFTTGGGSLVFNFALPVFVYEGVRSAAAWTLSPRFSLEPPSFGVTEGKFAHNTALGTDFQAEINGIKEVFKFYGSARFSYVMGNSTFYNGIQLQGEDRKGFFFNNYVIGVNIKDVFTLSYTKYWGSSNVKGKLSEFLAFTVEPNF